MFLRERRKKLAFPPHFLSVFFFEKKLTHPELAVDDIKVLVAEVGRHAVDVVLGVEGAEGREEAA